MGSTAASPVFFFSVACANPLNSITLTNGSAIRSSEKVSGHWSLSKDGRHVQTRCTTSSLFRHSSLSAASAHVPRLDDFDERVPGKPLSRGPHAQRSAGVVILGLSIDDKIRSSATTFEQQPSKTGQRARVVPTTCQQLWVVS
jgi:hypothetical protein